MDNKRITAMLKRHAGMGMAFKHSDAAKALRALLLMYTREDHDMLLAHCSVSPADFTDFLYADGKLTALQMTSLMSNLNYRSVFMKQETNELGHIAPEKLVQHIRVMQELNILNGMRAQKATDDLEESRQPAPNNT